MGMLTNSGIRDPGFTRLPRDPLLPFSADALEVTQRRFEAQSELMLLGRPVSSVLFLQEGWAIACRSLRSGCRQVTSVFVAGDLVGFPPIRRGDTFRSEISVYAATELRVAEIRLDTFQQAMALEPVLSLQMLNHEIRLSAILQERLVSLGRRSAQGRTAHFFLELAARVSQPDQPPDDRYPCPLSQYVVSDVLGLSAEHLNRVLRQLRLAQLLQVRGGRVDILNRKSLERLADFDPDYLSTD